MKESSQKPVVSSQKRRIRAFVFLLTTGFWLLATSVAPAAWFDAAWSHRRQLDVRWDVDHATGEEIAVADVLTAGYADEQGRDIRVATEDGKLVPSRILFMGPGDEVHVAFVLVKPVTTYFVYFGNKNFSAKPVPEFKAKSGLLMESRIWRGDQPNGFDNIERAWERGGDVIGRKYIPNGMLGYNPFGEQQQVVSKITGSFFAPIDGEYTFALSVDDVGALYVDGKALVFARIGPGDARFSGRRTLTRGKHDLLFYHVDYGGDTRFTIAWQTPVTKTFALLDRAELGVVFGAQEGPLEQIKKPFIADFAAKHVSECWVADNYSHRYQFTGQVPKGVTMPKFEWDFGDGQRATGKTVEHVFVTQGVYPVRVTAKIGANSDAQTTQLNIHRDYDAFRGNPLVAPGDDASVLAKTVATYDVKSMPLNWLVPAVRLLMAGNQPNAAIEVGKRIATEEKHPDFGAALNVLRDLPGGDKTKTDLWASVPANSDLQPAASRELATLLLWSANDFDRAVKVLAPFVDKADPVDKARYGQALVLAGKADEAAKIFEAGGDPETAAKRVAISGAMARTIESFLDDKDWESGDDTWNDWMTRFPSDFLIGYSAWLKVRLIESRGADGSSQSAARVAEAFARSVPMSSYAPRLLDKAAKLLEKSDAGKSQQLRTLLKERYPEDPLSQ